MTCSCGVDHWLHVALGFQGIIGMMIQLQGVPPSQAALEKLQEQLTKLQDQIEKLKRTSP